MQTAPRRWSCKRRTSRTRAWWVLWLLTQKNHSSCWLSISGAVHFTYPTSDRFREPWNILSSFVSKRLVFVQLVSHHLLSQKLVFQHLVSHHLVSQHPGSCLPSSCLPWSYFSSYYLPPSCLPALSPFILWVVKTCRKLEMCTAVGLQSWITGLRVTITPPKFEWFGRNTYQVESLLMP